MTDYDWLIVYDEIPKKDIGTIRKQTETLACPADRTILVTVEPYTIKIYPAPYTKQFGHILTTQPPAALKHPHARYGNGCLWPFYDKPFEQAVTQEIPEKTKLISTVCSSKQQTHTQHYDRYRLTKYLAGHMPELDWYGHGVMPVKHKYEALDAYKYHIAVENHIQPHHWTEKVSDALLAGCLIFYAGDPLISDCFPEGSIIPIPINDHPKALAIIQNAIAGNEYEKRKHLIGQARHLLAEKYNFYAQTSALIEQAQQHPADTPIGQQLKGRHKLRKNPVYALREACQIIRQKLGL